ncbi:MAG: histidine kinase N-terminal 7TM domain-containing protein [Haloarculaceae archaeon]
MAGTLGTGLFGLTILSGIVLCWLGGHAYRRWTEPGVTPFAAMAVTLGLSGIAGGVVGIVRGGAIPEDSMPLWTDVALVGWALAMIPWLLFALQYTGRHSRFRPRTIVAIAAPVSGIPLVIWLDTIVDVGSDVIVPIFGTVAFLYVLGLLIVGSYLVVRTTREYGHLSLSQGVSLAAAAIGPILVINSVGTLSRETSDAVVFGAYAVAFLMPAVALGLAVLRYDMFESTPAAGALGERAIPRETDDLVFVVDRDGRVIRINETAMDRLGVTRAKPLGDPLGLLLGTSVEELRETETVELETVAGKRRFDPQVSSFTDQHGRQLGSLLSLRDVTDRELRKQRLEVLNRVLRHNISNRVDVIKSNAEAVTAGPDSDYVEAIRNSADELSSISSKARATDALVSRPARTTEDDLAAVVRELTEDHTVALDLPAAAPLVTDWEALRGALDSAIENALEHAEESVAVTVEQEDDGYAVVVADDGSGIPESELASLDAGTETPLQHGTGIGLWQLKWAVTKLGGDVSFDTADGTTVRIAVPDQSS